jgi:hypothetical protein
VDFRIASGWASAAAVTASIQHDVLAAQDRPGVSHDQELAFEAASAGSAASELLDVKGGHSIRIRYSRHDSDTAR